MRSISFLSVLFLACATSAADWPAWRGPTGNNVATPGQKPVTEWDEKTNIIWKAAVPGMGRSSPIVVGERVLLTTADDAKQTQSVMCFDRATGEVKWTRDVHKGNLQHRLHKNNSNATSTLAFDGSKLFAVFVNRDRVQLSALSLEGEVQWTKDAGAYAPRTYQYGYGPSPTLFKGSVFLSSEYEDGWMAAFDTKDGKEQWRISRGANTSYSTPIVGRVAGRDQLLLSANDKVQAFDPASGRELWSAPGTSKATCGTMVWEGDVAFASGGFPRSQTVAVKADGSGKVLWTKDQSCYEPSILVHEGHVYAFTGRGIVYCWRATDGKEAWSQRLGGPVSASPVYANGHIYAANEKGAMFVFKADPAKFELVATNQLGDEGFCTIAVVDGKIFLRTASGRGDARRETLYCIGKP